MPDMHGQDGAPLGGSSGNVANAQAQASLAGVAGSLTYIAGFDVTFAGATAASVVVITVAGLQGGTQSYVRAVPAGATLQGADLIKSFTPPIPAATPGSAIVVTVPALGVGNTNCVLNVWGFTA